MPFPPVTSLTATRSGAQVNLTWTNPGGTDVVDIWRETEGGGGLPGRGVCIASTIAVTSAYTDTGASTSSRVRYRVYAGDRSGGSTYWSDDTNTSASAWVPVIVVSAPTGVQARRIGSDMLVTWTNPVAASTTGAVIQESVMGGAWSTIASPLGAGMTSWTHTSASQVVTHAYRVALTAAAGTSVWSGASNTVVVVAVPAAPTNLVSPEPHDPADPTVFGWTPNPVDTTAQTRYEVRYQVQGAPGWTSTGTVTSTTALHTVSGLGVGNYEWQVRTGALAAGFGPWSSTAQFVISRTPVAGIAMASPWTSATVVGLGTYTQPDGVLMAEARWTLTTPSGVEVVSGAGLTPVFTSAVNDGDTLTVALRVRSADGVWSSEASTLLVVSYAPPAVPTLSAIPDILNGSVQITATVAASSPPAVTVDILRDGVVVATVPPGGTWVDHRPPLGVPVTYGAVAVSALPSRSAAATATVDATGSQPRLWLNAGTGWEIAASLLCNPTASFVEKSERVLVQYRGRQWPVPYWGPSQSLAVTIKGLALTLRDLDQFRQIATYAGPVWYRDPDGRSFPISMESIQYAAGLGALPGIEVSITATKIGN